MCLGALYWARPRAVYFAATRADAAAAGFDDAFIYEELARAAAERRLPLQRIAVAGRGRSRSRRGRRWPAGSSTDRWTTCAPCPPPSRAARPITIELEGQPVRAYAGEPVAVALFAAGCGCWRARRSTTGRAGCSAPAATAPPASCASTGGPTCARAWRPARDGLRCERQNAFPDAEHGSAARGRLAVSRGDGSPRLMTGSRLGNELFVKLVRQMGGSGHPARRSRAERAARRRDDETVDLCIVGAGPAGLAAAARGAAAPARCGCWWSTIRTARADRCWPSRAGCAPRARAGRGAPRGGARLWARATAIGYLPEDDGAARPPRPARACWRSAAAEGLVRVARAGSSTPPAPTTRTCPSPTAIGPGSWRRARWAGWPSAGASARAGGW